jgi:hypothetical protein
LDPLWSTATRWHEAKLFVEHLTTICHDTLHLVAGLLIWLASAIVFKRPLSAWLPLFIVLALAMVNEAVDLWVELWPSPGMQLGEGTKDVAMTIAVPLSLFLALRFHPRLGGSNRR